MGPVNEQLAITVIEQALRAGVTTFCLCPGARNAPFIEVLDKMPDAMVLNFFDERDAAFFALGRAKVTNAPVAVIVTSGTAVSEIHSAVIEACYSSVPLLIISADRPSSYRWTGSPQAIDQAFMFGDHAWNLDVERVSQVALDKWSRAMPAHINVCFDEPLTAGFVGDRPVRARYYDEPNVYGSPFESSKTLFDFLKDKHRPLVIVGGLRELEDKFPVIHFLTTLGAPVLAEASSHIKHSDVIDKFILRGGESHIIRALQNDEFDCVLRIGDVPSFRIWRDLEKSHLPVMSLSRRPFPGLTHGGIIHERICDVLEILPPVRIDCSWADRLHSTDKTLRTVREELLLRHPLSEPALYRDLSRCMIADDAFVYLGNSTPVRAWNEFAEPRKRFDLFGENRGVNGIDGQLSSFYGQAFRCAQNYAVLGDLTTLCNLSAPWSEQFIPDHIDYKIIIVNNGGGQIFKRMFNSARYRTEHSLTFKHWAAMFGLSYATSLDELSSTTVLELIPYTNATEKYWADWTAEVKRI